MGNQSSKSKRAKIKYSKYDQQEIGILDQIFHEMAVRSPNDTIAKDTFLKFFDLPGVLGDRLFEVFDTKKTGVIDFEEFIDGFQRFARGDPSTKMDMLFQLFDLDGKGGITKQELSTVLMSIVTPPNQVVNKGRPSRRGSGLVSPVLKSEPTALLPQLLGTGNDSSGFMLDSSNAKSSFISYNSHQEVMGMAMVQKKVDSIVKQAFHECDADDSSRLDAQEFRNWIKSKPSIIDACEELFVQLAWNGPQTIKNNQFNMENAENMSRRYDKFEPGRGGGSYYAECGAEECKLRFVESRDLIPPPPESTESREEKEKELAYEYVILCPKALVKFCPKCGQSLAHLMLDSKESVMTESMYSLMDQNNNNYEGNLKMPVGKFRQLKTRYIVLHGKFLYIYKSKTKPFPETVVFIQGYFAELTQNPKFVNYAYIRLNPPVGSTGKSVNLYCDSGDTALANKWLERLEVSAQTVSISRYYSLGDTLGKGSFALVLSAKEKLSQREVAVKVIEKKLIDGKQKEYIRIEMSVMKLVRHPNVMRLEQVFETKSKIYMVMPLYPGGDLYEYMKHHARHGLTQAESKRCIYNVLCALKYLHSVGIVHRDLKPENLLLVREKEPSNIVITDFGLSKFAAPHEAMKAACGTLSYVAPEVLRMEGYGKEVDLWSCGVIMFLTLRAKLPFHDSTKNRIIARILRQNVQMTDPHWQKIDKNAKDLISKLLIKNPTQRITCDNALKHAWFVELKKEKEQLLQRLEKQHLGKKRKQIDLLPDKTGLQSVKDIKVYNDYNESHINADEEVEQKYNDPNEDENDTDDDSAPITVIRQNSIL